MINHQRMSSTLSVSKEANLDCVKMATLLAKHNIYTSISPNISTLPHPVKGITLEYGCRLRQSTSTKDEIQNIWTILQEKYNFKCAHLKVGNIYDGCVLDYLRPSLCSEK